MTMSPRFTRSNVTYEYEPTSTEVRSELVALTPNRSHRPLRVTASPTTTPSRSRVGSPREVQEISLNIPHHTQSHLETLQRPIPSHMTPREASFHRQAYTPHPMAPQPYPTPPLPSREMHSSLQIHPHIEVPRSPNLTAVSLPYRPPTTIVPSPNDIGRSTPHPFQVVPSSMVIRKPEPISWIKYPVEPHHIYPGPYAAVDVPFEDFNNNPSFDVPKPYKKAKSLSSTWGPQKLRNVEKNRKCVRFASTWGPAHPGGVVAGEYATINPKKLTSRYVRPAIFRRSNLKIDPRY